MADEDAKTDISTLVRDHHAAVYRYAFWLARSVPDAEDVTQQTFVAAQRNLEQLRDRERVRSWLLAIARSRFLKSRRRRRPKAAADIALDMNSVAEPASEDDEPSIDAHRLRQALEALPEEFRLVVLMFYFEQMKYREIAETLGLPIGTVMSRLARAKRFLRRELTDVEQRQVEPAVRTADGLRGVDAT